MESDSRLEPGERQVFLRAVIGRCCRAWRHPHELAQVHGAGLGGRAGEAGQVLTLVGVDDDGAFEVLVGSPTLADELLGTSSPFALAPVYDRIAKDLQRAGFAVRRNPLVHWPTVGQALSLARLRELSREPDGATLAPAVAELVTAGAGDTTPVRVRDWHHITWNNCLVENSTTAGRHVYLPTFANADHPALAAIDRWMKELWESLGFTAHLLGDFNAFASRQGVVHCIKKYMARGT